MPISITCPSCGFAFRIGDNSPSRNCPRCFEPFKLVATEEPAPQEAPSSSITSQLPPETGRPQMQQPQTQTPPVPAPRVKETLAAREVFQDQRSGLSTAQLLGIIGGLALGVGAFLPVVQVPIMGTVSFWAVGWGNESVTVEGVAVVVCGIMAIVAATSRNYARIFLIAVGSLIVVAIPFGKVLYRLQNAERIIGKETADNPLAREMAKAMLETTRLDYGWAVLALGVGLLFLAAKAGDKETSGL